MGACNRRLDRHAFEASDAGLKWSFEWPLQGSHVAKAVAYQAILQGHKVQYLETDDFFNRYALSAPEQ